MIEHRDFNPSHYYTRDAEKRICRNIFVGTDGRNHEIVYGETIYPVPGYRIEPFSFTDELAERFDGCELVIEPFQSTRTQHVIGDVTFMDTFEPLSNVPYSLLGSGTFLGLSPEGKVTSIPVSRIGHMSDQIKYGKGWTITWIAGQNGLKVMSISTPPFRPDMEVEVQVGAKEVNGVAIPVEYWERYNALKNPPQK